MKPPIFRPWKKNRKDNSLYCFLVQNQLLSLTQISAQLYRQNQLEHRLTSACGLQVSLERE